MKSYDMRELIFGGLGLKPLGVMGRKDELRWSVELWELKREVEEMREELHAILESRKGKRSEN